MVDLGQEAEPEGSKAGSGWDRPRGAATQRAEHRHNRQRHRKHQANAALCQLKLQESIFDLRPALWKLWPHGIKPSALFCDAQVPSAPDGSSASDFLAVLQAFWPTVSDRSGRDKVFTGTHYRNETSFMERGERDPACLRSNPRGRRAALLRWPLTSVARPTLPTRPRQAGARGRRTDTPAACNAAVRASLACS
jgi:hypothetical protein